MGWASGTDIFDSVVCEVVKRKNMVDTSSRRRIIRACAVAMEGHDWDVQSESEYWDHPDVRAVMEELHPDWDFDEEDEDDE